MITREHNGMAFTFREDGWFNMTKAAKAFGKQLQNFWNSPDTKAYMGALGEVHPDSLKSNECPPRYIPKYSQEWAEDEARDKFVKVIMGGRNPGTWGHPKLAVFFARWLDVRFAVWCDAMIEDILKGKAEVVVTKPQESAVLALPQDFASI